MVWRRLLQTEHFYRGSRKGPNPRCFTSVSLSLMDVTPRSVPHGTMSIAMRHFLWGRRSISPGVLQLELVEPDNVLLTP